MESENKEIQDSIIKTAKYVYDHGHTSLAIELFSLAVKNTPNGRAEHIGLAHAFLRAGNYSEGLKELDWIWCSTFPNQFGMFANNSSLSGLRILLSADAALGDTIQLCRFGKTMMARGAHITLEAQPELLKLLQNSEVAHEVVNSGNASGNFHLRIPLHNLMGTLNCNSYTIPTYKSYLNQGETVIENICEPLFSQKNRVGVCWSGHPQRPYDTRRSVPYDAFKNIFSIPDTDFFSLQLDNIPDSFPGINLANEIKDCNDTAALIGKMDLVITIDSMVAHLSGALGVPVILLNRLGGCWRWIDKSEYSIWYPSMKIITQEIYDDWHFVIEKATNMAKNMLENKHKNTLPNC